MTVDEAQISADPFVTAVRESPMPMLITDARRADNPAVFANDSFCRLTGYSRDEIVGRNCRFLQGPDTDPVAVQQIRESIEQARALHIDVLNYRKTGEAFWNRLFLAPVMGPGGGPTYFVASQVDVSIERERMAGLESQNAALLGELSDRLRLQEDSESQLRFATEAGRLGVWRYDIGRSELNSSLRFRKIFGRDPEASFTYADLREAVHPLDAPRMRAELARCMETGADYDIECRILRPGGELVWVLLRAQVQRDAAGNPVSMAGIALDITARKRQDMRTGALIELDAQLTTLENPADLAAAAVAALVHVLEVTRAGYGTIDPRNEAVTIESEWRASGIEALRPVERLRDYGSFVENLQRGEPVVIPDVQLDPRTAQHAAALDQIQVRSLMNLPIVEPNGLVALLFLNDVAPREWPAEDLQFIREVAWRTRMAIARRNAEKELRRLARELESKVEERSNTLLQTEAVLRQAQKMEAVGQLTGGIAHDFNNLLAANMGSLEVIRMLLSQGRVGEIERMVDAAQRSARSAATLTQRLLAFSRQQTLDPQPTEVMRLLADLEELIRRTAGPSVALEVSSEVPVWRIRVDRSQLESAVLNLCINARDAMPEGGRLTVTAANRTVSRKEAREKGLRAGDYVSVCVADTGTGMPEEIIARAFDPFFTTKPIGTGTGLGLSMVYGFAQQSGGLATIASTPGTGTQVCLLLPRYEGESATEATTEVPVLSPVGGNGEVVLVVDDEPTLRMLITQVLRESGYGVLEASTGAAALRVLQSQARVDLLITDIGLPGGMNGRQVADNARSLRSGLQVMFITGYAQQSLLDRDTLEPGMQLLSKPFELQQLASLVRTMIARASTVTE
jgi:PAS domain S-box-containing protein